uniref:Uncharacterized protein n=1 Tax=Natronobacterium sp. AS-7091 TaxID=198929 RepID=Q7ZA97_9EURY|nr:hypothetical protein [Natronobacterium sp. AS-7091]
MIEVRQKGPDTTAQGRAIGPERGEELVAGFRVLPFCVRRQNRFDQARRPVYHAESAEYGTFGDVTQSNREQPTAHREIPRAVPMRLQGPRVAPEHLQADPSGRRSHRVRSQHRASAGWVKARNGRVSGRRPGTQGAQRPSSFRRASAFRYVGRSRRPEARAAAPRGAPSHPADDDRRGRSR